jgi:2-polyprenyl-3-methyl-5-hydroxy-6-metoxy-1,4-benzoquinol methylase
LAFLSANLENGMPDVPTNAFDVVICEQVLEHLHRIELAIEDLIRVTRPGGTLFVGVPIFPPGLVLLRRHLIPRFDQWMGRKEPRSHVQAFTRAVSSPAQSAAIADRPTKGDFVSSLVAYLAARIRPLVVAESHIGSIVPAASKQAVARGSLDESAYRCTITESRLPKNTHNAA